MYIDDLRLLTKYYVEANDVSQKEKESLFEFIKQGLKDCGKTRNPSKCKLKVSKKIRVVQFQLDKLSKSR